MYIVAEGRAILKLLRSSSFLEGEDEIEEYLEHRIWIVGNVPFVPRVPSLPRRILDYDDYDKQIFDFYRRDLLSVTVSSPVDEEGRLFIHGNNIILQLGEGIGNVGNDHLCNQVRDASRDRTLHSGDWSFVKAGVRQRESDDFGELLSTDRVRGF